MSQQRSDGAGPAAAYVAALGGRLAADGCAIHAAAWNGLPVVLGSRSDRKARWFGTKTELFVFAAAVPEVDDASMVAFTGWAMNYAKDLRSGLPGARNAAMILPALVSEGVQPSAASWAAQDARLLGATLISRPITVETPASGAAKVTLYRGRIQLGAMFTSHVLEKASLYFP